MHDIFAYAALDSEDNEDSPPAAFRRKDPQSEEFQQQQHLQRGKMLAQQQQQQQQQQCEHQGLPEWSSPMAAHIDDLLPEGYLLQMPNEAAAAELDSVSEQAPGAAGVRCADGMQHAFGKPLEEQSAWVRGQEAREATQKQRLQQLQQQQSKRRRLAKQQQQQQKEHIGVSAALMQQQADSEWTTHNHQVSRNVAPSPLPISLLFPGVSSQHSDRRKVDAAEHPAPFPSTVLLPPQATELMHPTLCSAPHAHGALRHAQPAQPAAQCVCGPVPPSVPYPSKSSQHAQPDGREHCPPKTTPLQPVQPAHSTMPHPHRASQTSQHPQPAQASALHPPKTTPPQPVQPAHSSVPHPQRTSQHTPPAQTSVLHPPKATPLLPAQPAQTAVPQSPQNALQHTRPMVLHPPPLPTSPAPQPALSFVDTLQGLQAFFLHVRKARRFGFALHFCASNSSSISSNSGARAAQSAEVAGVAVSVEDGCCYYLPMPRSSRRVANSGGAPGSHRNAQASGGHEGDGSRRDGGHGDGSRAATAAHLWALTQERRLAERPRDLQMQGLQVLLSDPKLTKVSFKMKQQHQSLEGHPFLRIAGSCVDVWLALYLTEPTAMSGVSCSSTQALEQHLAKRAGRAAISQALQGLPVPGGLAFSTIELSKGEQEALRAAALSRKLYDALYHDLKKEGLLAPLAEIEMPLVPVIARMEARGMCFDPTVFVRQRAPLQQRLLQLEAKACKAARRDFDLKSPKQVSEVLFNTLKLEPPNNSSRGKSGYYSTSIEVLQEMVGQHPVVDAIVEHRRLAKLEGSLDGMLRTLLAQDPNADRIISNATAVLRAQAAGRGSGGSTSCTAPTGSTLTRLRGQFDQAGTATGRLTMDNPNLQTVPKPIEYELEGRNGGKIQFNMRAAFVASPGHVLLAVDYCQVELRLMAHFCRDETLCGTMQLVNEDPFKPIAAMWLRCKKEEVSKDQRNQAKQLTYAVLYGLGAYALAQKLNTDPASAAQLSRSFLKSMPGLEAWMKGVVEDCRMNGYVTMLSGRRRYLPDIHSVDPALQSAAVRQAINSIVQGSAADLIKKSMVALNARLQQEQLDGAARLVLQVHDELLFEVKTGHEARVAAHMQEVMSSAWELRVPFPVKVSLGPSWGELSED